MRAWVPKFSIFSETLENLSFQFFQKRLKVRFSILSKTIETSRFSILFETIETSTLGSFFDQ